MRLCLLGCGRHGASHYLKLHRNPEQFLGQIVVNLTSNAVSLYQNSSKLAFHLPEPQTISLPDQQTQTEKAEGVKPVRLIEVRLKL